MSVVAVGIFVSVDSTIMLHLLDSGNHLIAQNFWVFSVITVASVGVISKTMLQMLQ